MEEIILDNSTDELAYILHLICEGELFADTAGGDFTPHVVTVNTGEVIEIDLFLAI